MAKATEMFVTRESSRRHKVFEDIEYRKNNESTHYSIISAVVSSTLSAVLPTTGTTEITAPLTLKGTVTTFVTAQPYMPMRNASNDISLIGLMLILKFIA